MLKFKSLIIVLGVVFMVSSAFAKDTIDIAAIYSMSGPAAEGNAASIRGVRYAVTEINEQGGVLGKRINLLLLDNRSTPLGSDAAAERIAKADVTAIIGPQWSSHAIAVANVAQTAKIPMISNTATNPKVTRIGNYIFRVCFTDDFQGSVMARFARREINAATAVLFTDTTSDYSLKLSEIFRDNFEQAGGKILFEAHYKHKYEEYDKQIQQAKKADGDVLFIPGHTETGFIAKQVQDAEISSVLLGGDGWGGPAFLSRGGEKLKHGYYCTHWSEHNNSKISRMFVSKYKNTEYLSPRTALGYDAMMLLSDAIRRAGTTDRAKIRDALADTRNFEGVTGTISFDENGDPIKSAVIMEIKDGKPYYYKTIEP